MLSLRTLSGQSGLAALIGTSLLLPAFAMECTLSTAYAGVGRRHVAAEPPGELLLRVAGLTFDVQDIEVDAGSFAPVRFSLPSVAELELEGARDGVFILVRNVPESIILSKGFPTGRIWIVKLSQADNLRLSSSVGTSGRFELEFNLIGPENRVLGKKVVAVNVRSPAVIGTEEGSESPPPQQIVENTPSAPAIEAPKQEAKPSPPAAPALSSEEETVLLERGAEIMRQGGIAGARIIFEELASRGSQKGAFALARTYDPIFVKNAPRLGITANVQLALKWYEKAAALGSSAAEQRRAELAAGQ